MDSAVYVAIGAVVVLGGFIYLTANPPTTGVTTVSRDLLPVVHSIPERHLRLPAGERRIVTANDPALVPRCMERNGAAL